MKREETVERVEVGNASEEGKMTFLKEKKLIGRILERRKKMA